MKYYAGLDTNVLVLPSIQLHILSIKKRGLIPGSVAAG